MAVTIRQLSSVDAENYWRFRLEALLDSPLAFASDAEQHRTDGVALTAERLGHPRNWTLGAFVDGQLAGTMTMLIETRVKTAHKAMLVGVYVAPGHRGTGLARELLEATIARARATPPIGQVLLAVTVADPPRARRFYERAGFRTYGVEPRALRIGDEYVDQEMMLLDLRTEPAAAG
ncbi:MAG: GNAT family N-acetyltransferase [Bryobacteraceae bacterium]